MIFRPYPALFGLLTLTFFACSRGSDPVPPPVTPATAAAPDTLTAGWTRIGTGLSGQLLDIYFTDTLHGYTCGTAGLFRTADGGRSWTDVARPAGVSSGNAFNNIGAWGARAAFTDVSPYLYTASGYSSPLQAQAYTTALGAPGFQDVFFASADTVYYSSGRYFWRSVNGGLSADTLYNFGENLGANTLFFRNSKTGWLMRTSALYRTNDGGLHWSLLYTNGVNPGGLQFLDDQTGFFAFDNAVYRTTDGLNSANLIFVGTPPEAGTGIDLHFFDAQNGFICYGNRVYRTTDGGQHWTVVLAAGNSSLTELHFTDAHNGWACGSEGAVFRVRL